MNTKSLQALFLLATRARRCKMPTVTELTSQAIKILQEAYNTSTKYLPTPIYNVQGFGAKGDGVTDDTAAIQKAIDTAAPYVWNGTLQNTQQLTTATKVLFFPAGDYIVSDTVLLNPNILYMGYGATIKAKNFSDKQKFVAEAKVFKSDGTLAIGWAYGSTNYDIHAYSPMKIIGINFDGDTDGVYGGLSLTSFIYGILQDSVIKGKYVGLRIERSFNDKFDNIKAEGKYAGVAITSNTTNKFLNLQAKGTGDCTSAADIAALDAAQWLYRNYQHDNYKNYGRGLNLCWFENIEFDTLTVEGCYTAAFTYHCSLNIRNLYTEFVGYAQWVIPNVDSALFFGKDTKLTIDSHVWSGEAKYIFDGAYSKIKLNKSTTTDYANFTKSIKGIKGTEGTELSYDPTQYSLLSNDAALRLDEQIVEKKTLTNVGNATTVTYTKYQSGLMIVTATGFYSLMAPPYELTWTLPVPFKDPGSFTVHGMKASTGTYKKGSTVQPQYIIDASNVLLRFSENDINYNVTAIGFWK